MTGGAASNGAKLFHQHPLPFVHPTASNPPRPTSTPPNHFPGSAPPSSSYLLDEIVRPNSQPSVSSQLCGPPSQANIRHPLVYSPVVYPYGTQGVITPNVATSVAGVLPPYQYLAAVAAAAAAGSTCPMGNVYGNLDHNAASVQQQMLQQQIFYQQQMLQYQHPMPMTDAIGCPHLGESTSVPGTLPHPSQPHHPNLYGAPMGCSTDAESIATSEVPSLEESIKSPDSRSVP
jgi:hypothetical protein